MTAIGKMLVFLILVLSLVWNFLTINAYATRTNWRAESKKYADKAAESAQSATKMNELLEAERAAAEDAKRSLQLEKDRLTEQVARLKQERDTLNAQYQVAFGEAAKKAVEATRQDAIIEQQGLQVKALEEERNTQRSTVSALTIARDEAKVKEDQAKLDAKGKATQNEQLLRRIQDLSTRLNDIARGGRPGALGNGTPPADPRTRASVTAAEIDRNGTGIVVINLGSDAQLKQFTELRVVRDGPNGKPLGTLRLTVVEQKASSGQFTPIVASRDPNDRPRAGDLVVPIAPGLN